jgi:hypothetical protein
MNFYSPALLFLPLFTNCVEEKFCEVHRSKLPHSGGALGCRVAAEWVPGVRLATR